MLILQWKEIDLTAGRDEFFPISQAQMKWAKGNYTQNPGY